MLGAKRICRVRIAKEELEKMSKEDFHKSWLLQEQYVDYIETKLNENTDHSELVSLRESEEKLKQQQLEATRRENILVMRLTTKEQEMQEYAGQIQELKQAQIPTVAQLRSALLDPAVNLMFERMRKEIDTLKARLEETQDELSAWKFTPDSNTGKRLMAKCRLLHQENEELGKTLSSGRFAKLEGDLALQKSFSEEMKKSQSELDEFVMELDEDVEGMQSTIYYLQQQLRESKEQMLKLQKENEKLMGLSTNSPANHCIIHDETKEVNHEKSPLVPDAKPNTVTASAVCVKASTAPLIDLNRTENMPNPKPDTGTNSGQPWSPPPYEDKQTENSQVLNLMIKVEPREKNSTPSPKQPSPQSKPKKQEHAHTESATTAVDSTHVTVATARGSLHMEEYDSEQEPEPSTVTEECGSEDMLVPKPSESPVKQPATPSVNPKKVTEPVNKRTSENGGRGRKRTRSSRTQVLKEEDGPCELTAVKRLRRRDVIVEHEISDGDQKRTPLEIDTDTEVQVAHTLAQWAVTNKERKDIHNTSRDLVPETLGNGELKGNKNSEKAA